MGTPSTLFIGLQTNEFRLRVIHMNTDGTNPCPFPSNSSNASEERTIAPDSPDIRRIVIGEASHETHRHLQETSAALGAAYSRIRQIRWSLLQLAESLPMTLSQLRLQGREQSSSHADTFSLLLDFQHTAVNGQGDAFPDSNPRSMSIRQMSPTQSAPWNGNRTVTVSRTDRDAPGDDGSTLLGRRADARPVTVTSPTVRDVGDVALATNQLIQDAGRIYTRAYNSVVAVTRGYERILRIVGERRRTSPSIPFRPTSRASTPARIPSQSTFQLSPRQSPQRTTSRSPRSSLDSSLVSEWDLGPARAFSDIRHNTGPSERLPFPSDFSVQNLPRPSTPSISNTPDRPRISGEPLSNVSSETVDPTPESRYHLTADSDSAFQGRNYVVHRRYNRNGEELVHNITIDWNEDDSWSMPSPNNSRRHRNRFSNPRQDFDVLRGETLTTQPPQNSTAPAAPTEPSLPASASNSSVSLNSGESSLRRRGWGKFNLFYESLHKL